MSNLSASKIALVVDHPDRDGTGIVLTAAELAARGHETYVVPFNISSVELEKIQPDFVLLNYLRLNNESLARTLMKANVLVGVIDTEGGAIADYSLFKSAHTQDRDLSHNLNLFCSWNERFRQYLVDNDLVTAKVVEVTGQPRLDLYHSTFRRFFNSSGHKSANHSGYILINTTFALTSPRFSTPEKEKAQFIKFYNNDHEYVERVFKRELEYKKVFFEWLKEVVRRNPDKSFIYRPHPFESLDNYNTFLGEFKNIGLGMEGTVDGWIINSLGLIHSGCSTALEASFLGLPAFMPDYPHSPFCSQEIQDSSIKVSNLEDFLKKFENFSSAKAPDHAVHMAESILCVNDGRSFLRVADSIEKVLKESTLKKHKLVFHEEVVVSPTDSRLKSFIKSTIVAFRLQGFFKFGNSHLLNARRVEKWKKSAKYFQLPRFHQSFLALLSDVEHFKGKTLSISQFENSLKIWRNS